MTALQLLGYINVAFGLQILIVAAIVILLYLRRSAMDGAEGTIKRAHDSDWQGTRDFRVTARVFEDLAQTQCSLTLAPVDGNRLLPFKPGQFLTFSLPVAGPEALGRVVRCYSISDTPDPAHYRITVKRAAAPPGRTDVPTGVASTWIHDHAPTGTILQVRAPAGQFILSPDAEPSPVFIAGGIGITPILSMLRTAFAAMPKRRMHLFYGVRNGQDHAFNVGLEQLAQAHPGFSLHVLYSDPAADDVKGQDYDLAGFITTDLLKQTLPHGRHAFYICGPDPMMKALIPALLGFKFQVQRLI